MRLAARVLIWSTFPWLPACAQVGHPAPEPRGAELEAIAAQPQASRIAGRRIMVDLWAANIVSVFDADWSDSSSSLGFAERLTLCPPYRGSTAFEGGCYLGTHGDLPGMAPAWDVRSPSEVCSSSLLDSPISLDGGNVWLGSVSLEVELPPGVAPLDLWLELIPGIVSGDRQSAPILSRARVTDGLPPFARLLASSSPIAADVMTLRVIDDARHWVGTCEVDPNDLGIVIPMRLEKRR